MKNRNTAGLFTLSVDSLRQSQNERDGARQQQGGLSGRDENH